MKNTYIFLFTLCLSILSITAIINGHIIISLFLIISCIAITIALLPLSFNLLTFIEILISLILIKCDHCFPPYFQILMFINATLLSASVNQISEEKTFLLKVGIASFALLIITLTIADILLYLLTGLINYPSYNYLPLLIIQFLPLLSINIKTINAQIVKSF